MDSFILLLCTLICLGCVPGAYQDDSTQKCLDLEDDCLTPEPPVSGMHYLAPKCPALEDDGLTPEPPVPGMRYLAQKPGEDLSGVPDNVKDSGNTMLMTRTFPTEQRPEECDNCYPYIYRTVIGVKGCEDKPDIKVLIIVTSVPNEPQMRQAIRETWGQETEATRTVFLFGVGWGIKSQKILDEESQKYGDILQENYIDSYFNLTLKVLSGFHWWSRKCANAPFVLRTASDNFVNVANLLKQAETAPDLMIGTCGTSAPSRDVMSKFYVSPFEYPEKKKYYPTFCLGTSFLSPKKVTELIIRKSPNVPYFALEDIYFGMLLVHMKLPPVPVHGFNAQYKRNGNECEVDSKWLNLHPVPHHLEMRWIENNCKPQ